MKPNPAGSEHGRIEKVFGNGCPDMIHPSGTAMRFE
jgi:hypothetical protein